LINVVVSQIHGTHSCWSIDALQNNWDFRSVNGLGLKSATIALDEHYLIDTSPYIINNVCKVFDLKMSGPFSRTFLSICLQFRLALIVPINTIFINLITLCFKNDVCPQNL
jgi:hypothetical protein